jgi:hypothetical protein
MDTYEGADQDPLSLHKYLYAEADPVNDTDPSGNLFSPSNAIYGNKVHEIVTEEFCEEYSSCRTDESIDSILETDAGPLGGLRPDLVKPATAGITGEVYEIASFDGAAVRATKLLAEVATFDVYDPRKRSWTFGYNFVHTPYIQLDPLTFAIVYPPAGGLIVYGVVNTGEIYFLVALAIKGMSAATDLDTGLSLAY